MLFIMMIIIYFTHRALGNIQVKALPTNFSANSNYAKIEKLRDPFSNIHRVLLMKQRNFKGSLMVLTIFIQTPLLSSIPCETSEW